VPLRNSGGRARRLTRHNAVVPTIDVNGLTMYYEFHGEPGAPPLVFICGLRLDVSEIQPLLSELARGYRVLAFDNRGAGRTDKPDAPYTIPMMAADTAALMRAVGMPRAAVLGLSMGGRIALSLALDTPETVSRLILASTGARVAVYVKYSTISAAPGNEAVGSVPWLASPTTAATRQRSKLLATCPTRDLLHGAKR